LFQYLFLINTPIDSYFPLYLSGSDIAGEVISVGPGVNAFSAGDKVFSGLDVKVNVSASVGYIIYVLDIHLNP
jgi:hypothetical protein